ncbi:hypothetical protein OH76DRAFT_946533 [Lentinus brumalis]|uniref:Uncharacterized protein n=1 Tax=Lentinus brumalis TaxID=2498619 RepID=A0A371CZ48_9APHY|nr:hypothetical protein OH76DRAFT_946533 [Polyporus brumalis]
MRSRLATSFPFPTLPLDLQSLKPRSEIVANAWSCVRSLHAAGRGEEPCCPRTAWCPYPVRVSGWTTTVGDVALCDPGECHTRSGRGPPAAEGSEKVSGSERGEDERRSNAERLGMDTGGRSRWVASRKDRDDRTSPSSDASWRRARRLEF